MWVVLGVLGCGKVTAPIAGDAALPAADAEGLAPDATPDAAVDATIDDAAPVIDAPPDDCGNGVVDPGEDCDGSEGCPPRCHVVPPAGSVALRFRGTVTLVQDDSSVFSGRVVIGTPIWGRLVYPTNLTDSDGRIAVGVYAYNDLDAADATGLWMTVADWQFSPARGSGDIRVGNGLDPDPDAFFAQLGNGISVPKVEALQGLGLDLQDPSRTALTQDRLPRTSFPDAAAWTTRNAFLHGDNTTGLHWFIASSVDELTLEVP